MHAEYRHSANTLYRRIGTVNEVLTPWGWTLATFFPGASGWLAIERFTEPLAEQEVAS
jgi:hypothetical protein